MPQWLNEIWGPPRKRSDIVAELHANRTPGLHVLRLEERLVLTTAPVAVDDSALTDQGNAIAIDVLSNDTDAEGNNTIDPTTVAIVPGMDASNGITSINPVTGVITYTPTGQFTGVDTFQYTVMDQDGNTSNAATVTVTVNDPPVANDDSITTQLNTAVIVNVLTNDTDSDGTLVANTVTVSTPATNGTAVANADGTITYTPTNGFTGTDTFQYTVMDNDGGTSNAATVTVTVNDPPVANDDSITTQLNTAVIVNVLTNDTDSDGTLVANTVTVSTQATNGTAVANADGTITYTPTNGFTGTDTFQYTVMDNDGGTSNAATVTVTVNDPPVGLDDDAVTQIATPVTITVLANDTDSDGTLVANSVTVSTQATNGTAVANADGTITYTPTGAFVGTDTFQYTVDDNDGGTSNFVTVTVRVNDPPVANDDNANTAQATAAVITVLANDTDSDGTLVANTVTVSTQATNGTAVANADGTITYTPNVGFSGTDSFEYTVDDNDGATSSSAVVTVVVNNAPVAADDPNNVTQLNTAIVINVLANDSDGDGTLQPGTVTIVAGMDASSGTTQVLGNGTIRYTPNNGFTGTDTFVYTVMDDDGATSNQATVTVRVNAPPIAVDDPNVTTNAGTAVIINVLANDSDSDGTLDVTTVDIVNGSGPSNGGVVVNANGTITYTPNGGFTGVDTFRYTVMDNDGATSNEATVTVTVNAFPVAVDDPGNVAQLNTALTITVLTNDSDSDGTLVANTVTVTTQATNGTAVANADGTITYTPDNGFTGIDTFQYTVQDDQGATSNAATVTVRVNAPPVAVDDLDVQMLPAETNKVVSVLANDSDSDGTLVANTVTVTTQATSGTAVANADGTITYTPNAGFMGNDTFQYTVMDNDGATSNTATVTISINDPPVAVDDAAVTDEDMAVVINVAANDQDSDGTLNLPSTALVGGGPANGNLVNNGDGTFTYTPNQHYSGTDSFQYRILDDDKGVSNIATVSVTITPDADAPTLTVGNATGNEGVAFTLPIMGSLVDLDGSEEMSIQLSGLPTDVVLVAPSGNLTGMSSYTLTNLTPAQVASLQLIVPDDATFAVNVSLIATETANADSESTVDTLNVVVNNVAPSLGSVGLTVNAITEGDTTTLTGSVAESGADTVILTIAWGDEAALGTTPQVIVINPTDFVGGVFALNVTHTYVDDPTGAGTDAIVINVGIDDGDGGADADTATLTIANALPALSNVSFLPATINESESATLAGVITVPTGVQDSFTLEIDWDDGSPVEIFNLPQGTTNFAFAHQYVDDNPSVSSVDTSTVQLRLIDDDSGEVLDTATVDVANVAPTVTASASDISTDAQTTLTLNISDPGPDTFTVAIRWGDTNVVLPPQTAGTIVVSHTYVLGNPNPTDPTAPIPIEVIVIDDDFGVTTVIAIAEVLGAGLSLPQFELPVAPTPIVFPVVDTGDAPTPVPTPTPAVAQTLESSTAAGEAATTVEKRVLLRQDPDTPYERVVFIFPNDDILDDLDELFQKLQNGHYGVYLEQDGTQQVVVVVFLRNGKPYDPNEIREGTQELAPTASKDSTASSERIADATAVDDIGDRLRFHRHPGVIDSNHVEADASSLDDLPASESGERGEATRVDPVPDDEANLDSAGDSQEEQTSDSTVGPVLGGIAVGSAAAAFHGVSKRSERIETRDVAHRPSRSMLKAARLYRRLRQRTMTGGTDASRTTVQERRRSISNSSESE